MTLKLVGVLKVRCDGCHKVKFRWEYPAAFNEHREGTIDAETAITINANQDLADVKYGNWKVDAEHDRHLCPDCRQRLTLTTDGKVIPKEASQ